MDELEKKAENLELLDQEINHDNNIKIDDQKRIPKSSDIIELVAAYLPFISR
jgi:hypothetical protein